MKLAILFVCIVLFLTLCMCGCISDFAPTKNHEPSLVPTPENHPPVATTTATIIHEINISGPGSSSYSIPVLLTDIDWQLAGECGMAADNLSQSASLFIDDCQIQQLLRDGWEIVGIGYDMNLIGSRCRQSTHEDVKESCDWCLDAGPTLSLRYRGITTEYLANMKEKKVIHFVIDIQGNTSVVDTGDSEIIMFRNGTDLYTFRSC
jgi:hypothetical protein